MRAARDFLRFGISSVEYLNIGKFAVGQKTNGPGRPDYLAFPARMRPVEVGVFCPSGPAGSNTEGSGFHLHQPVEGDFTPEQSNMLGTQKEGRMLWPSLLHLPGRKRLRSKPSA